MNTSLNAVIPNAPHKKISYAYLPPFQPQAQGKHPPNGEHKSLTQRPQNWSYVHLLSMNTAPKHIVLRHRNERDVVTLIIKPNLSLSANRTLDTQNFSKSSALRISALNYFYHIFHLRSELTLTTIVLRNPTQAPIFIPIPIQAFQLAEHRSSLHRPNVHTFL